MTPRDPLPRLLILFEQCIALQDREPLQARRAEAQAERLDATSGGVRGPALLPAYFNMLRLVCVRLVALMRACMVASKPCQLQQPVMLPQTLVHMPTLDCWFLTARYANPFNRRVWDTLPPHASLPYAWDQVRHQGNLKAI